MNMKKLIALSALMLLPLTACDKKGGTSGNPGGDPGDGDPVQEYFAADVCTDISEVLEETNLFEYDSDDDAYYGFAYYTDLSASDEDLEAATTDIYNILPEYLEVIMEPYMDTWEEDGTTGCFAWLCTPDGYVSVELGDWYEDSEYGVCVQICVYEEGGEGGGGDEPPVLDGDILNATSTGITSNKYAEWEVTGASGAVYKGQSATNYSAIALRKTSPSGIVTTKSGGKIRTITVVWNSNTVTSSERAIDIYVSNTAYSGPADLYANSTKGTKVGSITYGTSTTLTISGDYAYFGIVSTNGTLYLDSISFEWEA